MTLMKTCLVIAAVFAGVASMAAVGEGAPSEPDSYRMQEYRAPTPATLTGHGS